MRRIDGGAKTPKRVHVHADFFHAGGKVGLVEHAQHAFLAVDVGKKGYAQVIVTAGHFDSHAAVLGKPPFGDVETAHDLEARHQSDGHILGRRSFVEERAVNPVAQADHFLKGLEVDVAGAVLDRLDQDEVGELNYGRFLGRGGQFVEVDLF